VAGIIRLLQEDEQCAGDAGYCRKREAPAAAAGGIREDAQDQGFVESWPDDGTQE